jgi:hypothetical protein
MAHFTLRRCKSSDLDFCRHFSPFASFEHRRSRVRDAGQRVAAGSCQTSFACVILRDLFHIPFFFPFRVLCLRGMVSVGAI